MRTKINDRARELREEPDMPEKSLRWYRKLILEAQAQLCNVLLHPKARTLRGPDIQDEKPV